MVFASQRIHTREVIYSLIGFHSIQFVNLYCSVCPEQVPLVVRILVVSHVGCSTQSHFKLVFCNVAHNVILGLRNIKNELLSFKSPPFFHHFIFFFLAFGCQSACRSSSVLTCQRTLCTSLIWCMSFNSI